MTIVASFTVSADAIDSVVTCLNAMCGVGIQVAGTNLTVEVWPPYGEERMGQVRATILSIDPEAVEAA